MKISKLIKILKIEKIALGKITLKYLYSIYFITLKQCFPVRGARTPLEGASNCCWDCKNLSTTRKYIQKETLLNVGGSDYLSEILGRPIQHNARQQKLASY